MKVSASKGAQLWLQLNNTSYLGTSLVAGCAQISVTIYSDGELLVKNSRDGRILLVIPVRTFVYLVLE